MTAPERPAFSEEKSAILTDPAYSFLSFKEHRNLGVTRLLSQSTGDESSLGATQQRSKLRNQLKIFFRFPFLRSRWVSRKKRQQLEKKRSKQVCFSYRIAIDFLLQNLFGQVIINSGWTLVVHVRCVQRHCH